MLQNIIRQTILTARKATKATKEEYAKSVETAKAAMKEDI